MNKILVKFFAGLFLGCIIICRALVAAQFQPATIACPFFSVPVGGAGDSSSPIVSRDGRYILFASAANNLVLGPNSNALPAFFPSKLNVFLRDRTNGTTVLVSVNVSGLGGANSDAMPVDISTNGQYVLFESSANNLTTNATNNLNNIFVRDLLNSITKLVGVSTNGTAGNGASRGSTMSSDGRYVAFTSEAKNLTSNSTAVVADIFLRDLQAGTTTLVTRNAMGAGSSELPDLTPDGHYLAYYSTATNLAPGITTSREIYVYDVLGGTTTLASAAAHTPFGATTSLSFNHSLSDDGQYVAFEAMASAGSSAGTIFRFNRLSGVTDVVNTNAVTVLLGSELSHHSLDISADGRFVAFVGKTNSVSTIFVWDGQSGSTTLASGDTGNNVPASSSCDYPVLDASGRFVTFVFTGIGIGLTSATVIGGPHIYTRDLQAGVTTLVDADTNGIGSASPIDFPAASADNSVIAFEAHASTLVANDTNTFIDIFARATAGTAPELISARRPELPSQTLLGPSGITIYSVSPNGRYIAFYSDATNAAPNGMNGYRQIYVRDALAGTNVLASVDTGGIFAANGYSYDPAISADGRFVAFTSSASNLVASDTNLTTDVFVRDLQLGATTLVSVNTGGVNSANGPSYSPVISANGRYVLFHSLASTVSTNVLATNHDNVFWRDLQTKKTVNLNYAANVLSAAGGMSPDGRFVVAGGTNVNLFLWDMQTTNVIYTNTTKSAEYAGVSPDGTRIGFITQGAAGHVYAADRTSHTTNNIGAVPATPRVGLRFSFDSRYMVYVGADANKVNQIYLYDFQTGSNTLVSQNFVLTGGGSGHSDSPDISSDGRLIAFRSLATNLIASGTGSGPNIYLYDRLGGSTTLATASQFGNFAASGASFVPVFSGDAQNLFLESFATDLAPQALSQRLDVFELMVSTNAPLVFSLGIVPAAPGSVMFSWPVVPAKTYQVQYKANLSDASWTPVNSNYITLLGNQATLTDPNPTTQRYYRVVAF